MENKISFRWKRTARLLSTATAVVIGLLIAGIIFFKFTPGFGFYIVQTGSMEPSIKPGDLIFTTPAEEKIEPGRIITYRLDDNILVTHRVLSVEDGMILTKGDANEDPDNARISPSQVKGAYLFKIPFIGRVTDLLRTKTGWFFIVLLPSFLLVIWIFFEIAREILKGSKTGKAAVEATAATAKPGGENVEVKTTAQTGRLPGPEALKQIREELNNVLKDVYYSK
ncbi:MAG: signal peptidase I [Dehalococcoidales bacterium]|nr:signal peptidase I [Dehalococcoidales bacterium]